MASAPPSRPTRGSSPNFDSNASYLHFGPAIRASSPLDDLLGIDGEKLYDNRLYMELTGNRDAAGWTALQNDCYLLRANLTGKTPEELWRTYIGLTEAEAAFRALLHALRLRPPNRPKCFQNVVPALTVQKP